jgi:two-component system LytT family response regulator
MKSNKYTVVIIDDETICIENISRSIAEFTEFLIVGTAQTSQQGREQILQQHPDLVFLDVELPGQSGLELLNEIREQVNWTMHVIFYTSYEKYLLEALRSSAFDYLLKPYDQSEFRMIINRFLSHLTSERAHHTFQDALFNLIPSNRPFLLATINGYQMLRKEQIGYFEYQKEKKLWIVVLSNQTKLQLKRSSSAEDILNYASHFIQISQRHIINLDYLSTIVGKDCQLLPPFHQITTLTISRNFLKLLEEKFDTI